MALTLKLSTARPAFTPGGSLKARSPLIYPSSNQPQSSWSSISRPPRNSVSPSRPRSSPGPTRSLNEEEGVHSASLQRRDSVAIRGERAAACKGLADRLDLAWWASNGKFDRGEFRQGLKELGYIEGQNIIVEYRFGEGQRDRTPDLVDELVRLQPDVLVALVDITVS